MAKAAAPARLDLSTKLFYGSGSVAFGVKDQGFSYLLLIFYNQVIGLSSQVVGAAIMVALIIDAFLDPIVGQASDNLRSRWGRRHPFMYAAAIPVAVSYLALWNPPQGLSEGAMFAYLVVTAIIIRSFITCYEIPSAALVAELTDNYDERTSIMSFRYFFGWCGGLTMTLAAFQIFLKPDAEHPVGQLNRAGYSAYAVAASLVMLAAILISSLGTHRHIPHLKTPPQRKLTLGQLGREMFATLSHKTFLTLLLAGLFSAMAGGLVLSLNLYFNTYFWELSANQISVFVLGNFVSAALAFLAVPLSRRFSKKPTAMVLVLAALIISSTPIALRLLGLFPPNGSPLVVPLLFAQTVISTALSIGGSILMSSMIADVVEDSELRTGRRSEGLFFAANAFVAKAVSGIGIFSSSLILLAVGFPQNAQPGQVAPEVIRDLALTYLPTLAALYALSIGLLSLYRITRGSHEETLRKLADAAAEAERVEAPGTPGATP